MSKTLLETLAAQIPADEAAFYDLTELVAERVAELLHARGWSQRDLAGRLGKPESYVSRLLGGAQNVTLKTLGALQAAFGEPIVTTPAQLRRDAEDNFHALAETIGLLSLSSSEPPGIVYDEMAHWPAPQLDAAAQTAAQAPEAWSFGRSPVLDFARSLV